MAMLESDLWNGCESFYDAISEAISSLDPQSVEEASKGRFSRTDILSRHLLQRFQSIEDQSQARAFERMWIDLDLSFQKLVSARRVKHPLAPSK